MSCMMLTDKHIAAIVGIPCPITGPDNDETIEHKAGLLVAANFRAFSERYPDEKTREACGISDDDAKWRSTPAKAIELAKSMTAVELLKSCQCFEYQANEADDWKSSKARDIVEQAVNRVVGAMAGYDDAPWGLPY